MQVSNPDDVHVFDFGIRDYRPRWLGSLAEVAAVHGRQLRSLAGRHLTHTWVVWDLDDDEWFADCPILFDFDGEQVEINHMKFADLSITWNMVDPEQPVRWPPFRLAWRDNKPAQLAALHGQSVESVELLEWLGGDDDMANGSVAVHLTLTNGDLTIYNALDENGLDIHPPEARWHHHALT